MDCISRRLPPRVNAVSDADNNGTEGGLRGAGDLAGGVAFLNHQHAFGHSRLHAIIIVEEKAAANLVEKDYYRWIFANEPDWEEYR